VFPESTAPQILNLGRARRHRLALIIMLDNAVVGRKGREDGEVHFFVRHDCPMGKPTSGVNANQ